MDPSWSSRSRAALPELPRARRQRFVSQYGLPAYDAELLTQSRALADYYEAAVRAHAQSEGDSNWVMSELLRELGGDDDAAPAKSPVGPTHLAGLVRLIDDGTIRGKIAKDVFARMLASGEEAATIVRREGLTQVGRCRRPRGAGRPGDCRQSQAVADFKAGKTVASKSLSGRS